MATKLTREQAAIVSVFTGVLCGPFEDVQKLVEELLGRPVWTHELANKDLNDQIREAARPRFLAICADKES